jgi:glyoxylase-like metal-dependent hydrolase (beta-lactamase superfamily II)
MKLRTLAAGLALATPLLLAAAQAAPLELLPVQGDVWLLAGGPTNVAVQVGREGILLVDAPPEALTDEAMALLHTVSKLPVRFVITTALDPERTRGDRALGRYSEPLPGTERAGAGNVGANALTAAGGAVNGLEVLAHENVLNRLSSLGKEAAPGFAGAFVTSEYFLPWKDFPMNGEAVIVTHLPAAHSDGDSLVHFRRSDVLVTGDVFTPGQFPRIDLARGGSVQGELDALNRILDIAVPGPFQEGGTMVVPGRGRLCDEADVVEYRDMVKIITDRVQEQLRRKQTLAQVLAARPAQDYETEYGGARGGPGAGEFVTAIYQSLAAPAKHKEARP